MGGQVFPLLGRRLYHKESTNCSVCPTTCSAVVLESLLPQQAYDETSIRVQPRPWTSGCRRVLRRCSLGQCTYLHRFAPMGDWTSSASNWDTILLYNLVRTLYPSRVVCKYNLLAHTMCIWKNRPRRSLSSFWKCRLYFFYRNVGQISFGNNTLRIDYVFPTISF